MDEIKPSKDQRRFGPLGRTKPGQPLHPGAKPTQPWASGNAQPWHMDMLKLAKTRPGFRQRWVAPAKVEQKQMQGFTFADPKDYGVERKIIGEPTKDGNRIIRREMTLMEIPEERAKARERYYENLHLMRERSRRHEVEKVAAQVGQELGQSGSLVHGEIKKDGNRG